MTESFRRGTAARNQKGSLVHHGQIREHDHASLKAAMGSVTRAGVTSMRIRAADGRW